MILTQPLIPKPLFTVRYNQAENCGGVQEPEKGKNEFDCVGRV